jgi:hypothetical protein
MQILINTLQIFTMIVVNKKKERTKTKMNGNSKTCLVLIHTHQHPSSQIFQITRRYLFFKKSKGCGSILSFTPNGNEDFSDNNNQPYRDLVFQM